MKKYKKKCYNCGNVDRFTIKEMSNLHFCQRCYKEHDKMCDVLANSVLELEKQNKRYREAIENIKKYNQKALKVGDYTESEALLDISLEIMKLEGEE